MRKATLVAGSCRSVYIAHNMASDGLENTSSAAILWAIYINLHGFATRGALLESGHLALYGLQKEGPMKFDKQIHAYQFQMLCALSEKVALKMNVTKRLIKYVRYYCFV